MPQRSAGLAIRIEGVNAIVLGRDENHVVRAAGNAEFRHEKRLAVYERIDAAGKYFAE